MIKTESIAKIIRKNRALKGELVSIDIAVQLTVLVADSGLSRVQLAEKLGYSQSRVSQILSGSENLTVATVAAFAGALGKKLRFAFDDSIAQPAIKKNTGLTTANVFAISAAKNYSPDLTWEDTHESTTISLVMGEQMSASRVFAIAAESRSA